jgi:hypothetical protein
MDPKGRIPVWQRKADRPPSPPRYFIVDSLYLIIGAGIWLKGGTPFKVEIIIHL